MQTPAKKHRKVLDACQRSHVHKDVCAHISWNINLPRAKHASNICFIIRKAAFLFVVEGGARRNFLTEKNFWITENLSVLSFFRYRFIYAKMSDLFVYCVTFIERIYTAFNKFIGRRSRRRQTIRNSNNFCRLCSLIQHFSGISSLETFIQ